MNENFKVFTDLFTVPEWQNNIAAHYLGKSYTYGQMNAAIDLCASDLYKLGVRKGDHVALWSTNCAEWLVTFFAIARLGGVAVLTNYSLPLNMVAGLLGHSHSRFLAFGNNKCLLEDPEAHLKLADVLKIGDKIYDIRKTNIWERVANGEKPEGVPAEERDPQRSVAMIFTSGTTAIPKMVMLSQAAIIADAGFSADQIDETSYSVALGLPLFHSYALAVSVCCFTRGTGIYMPDDIKPECLMTLIFEHKLKFMCSVGVMYLGMFTSPMFDKLVVPSLQIAIVGGAFTSPEKVIAISKKYPSFTFVVGYGQSEASPIISLSTAVDSIEKRAYTVGKPMDCLTLVIKDKDGVDQPTGTSGEICIKGRNVMNGYFGLPEEQQPFDKDGWLHTGDLGYLDAEGYLHFVGRLKDIIIKNGENISPAEIEGEILKCGGIREVKVLGFPHPKYGEDVAACVVPEDLATFSEEALLAKLRNFLPNFKLPAHIFAFDKFPMLATGKVDMKTLSKLFADRLTALE